MAGCLLPYLMNGTREAALNMEILISQVSKNALFGDDVVDDVASCVSCLVGENAAGYLIFLCKIAQHL